MRFNEDKRVKFDVPFLNERTILFIDSESGLANGHPTVFWEDLYWRFEELDYKFLYLPDLVGKLHAEVMHYMFPGNEGAALPGDMYNRIREQARLGDKCGFLYKQNALTFFHIIPDSAYGEFAEGIDKFIGYLREIQEAEYSDVRFGVSGSDDDFFEIDPNIDFSRHKIEAPRFAKKKNLSDSASEPLRWTYAGDPDQLDPKTWAILEAWDRIEKEFGITIQDMDVLLGYRVKLSRLSISKSNRISLIDWENNPEVKMDDITKTLYFFFLKHPEGTVLKVLDQYRDEFLSIYMEITGREDLQGIKDSIDRLISPYSDGRNTSMSRIRKAFKDIVGKRAAQFYYIDGKAGGTYTIHLERDLVLWEY